ncbi:MAG TPA: DUF2600 family protein [Solirubrobacteraceae bacterium]|jgi:tetraprenyl-beta-curcumene synthase|nr:DUF2600 family protein [Solirubrobacteraceae bacterium]
MAPNALGDRRLVARAGLALVLANGRYWTSVAPIVRSELKRWRLRAEEIDDPELRALALAKLDGESFHAEAAATLATLAPRTHRRSTAEAIVAVEVLFDYLDGLTERRSPDPLQEGERSFAALIGAVAASTDSAGDPGTPRGYGGYLEALSRAAALALARLPGAPAIAGVAKRTAERGAQAQTRMHAAGELGVAQVEEWAIGESHGTGLGWQEFVAGSASSVLVLHALIAAAANPRTTTQDAAQIAEAYLSTCVVLTLLDGLVDYEHDAKGDGSDAPGYLTLYEHPDELADTMGKIARRAVGQARALPNGAHHVMLLTGVVAYYSSAPGAQGELARPVITRLRRGLEPLISPTLAIMRAWRSTRRRAGSFGAKGEDRS